ncbi:MAG: hypothetical protein PUH97_07380 [Dialister sp.]|nr:hypothetical protein [Dialister sp.]MDD7198092.1 hypothetical protein [Dialister sp.]MDD7666347.1 hypothetical protein [Dialister sp.]MDY2622028.1 hypothetical protein [Dialister sp.]MDY5378343.1 hypothetical protein [Dialister sp.]
MTENVIDKFVTPSGAYGMTHPFVKPNVQTQYTPSFWETIPPDTVAIVFIIIIAILTIWLIRKEN